MKKRHPYGQRRSPAMTTEEREVAVRLKAEELQPEAPLEMQLVLYAELLLDMIVMGSSLRPRSRRAARIMLVPPSWREGIP